MRNRPLAFLIVIALGLGAGCTTQEQRRQTVARSLFDRYCAECHGLSATGPEPVADLGYDVPDVRRLRGRYGDPLSRERLALFIDGRHEGPADPGREMPRWGERLYTHMPEEVKVDEMRAGTIELLIEYLEKIQE